MLHLFSAHAVDVLPTEPSSAHMLCDPAARLHVSNDQCVLHWHFLKPGMRVKLANTPCVKVWKVYKIM